MVDTVFLPLQSDKRIRRRFSSERLLLTKAAMPRLCSRSSGLFCSLAGNVFPLGASLGYSRINISMVINIFMTSLRSGVKKNFFRLPENYLDMEQKCV